MEETAASFRAVLKEYRRKIFDRKPPYLVFKACFGATLACKYWSTTTGRHRPDRQVLFCIAVLLAQQ